MLFNSIDFLIFFPVVTLLYYIIPRKAKTLWLLVSSYYFYMSWNPYYAILIGISTVITYLCGLSLEYFNNKKQKSYAKLSLMLCLVSNLLILAVFKYADFAINILSDVALMLGITIKVSSPGLLLPVGISFYTFQALSYSIDVYKGTSKAEHNLIRYALFVSFFPQLVAGPIERTGNLLSQIQSIPTNAAFSFERMRSGLLLMVWGFFQKLVIADRAAVIVDGIYNNYTDYGFFAIFTATICFAIQIYCDFAGYTNIARGAARILGFELMKNFRQPYFAAGIKDFWRRWHISLTTWFTDYLYIPLGGSRKGFFKTLLNIMIVFTVSGLWHGASFNFVIWGLIHGIYRCIGIITSRCFYEKQKSCKIPKFLQIAFTFLLVCFAWIFFRADSVTGALLIIKQMFTGVGSYVLSIPGLNSFNIFILVFSVIVLFVVDYICELGISIENIILRQNIVIRWLIYALAVWSVIMLGIYGVSYTSSQFIYFQF